MSTTICAVQLGTTAFTLSAGTMQWTGPPHPEPVPQTAAALAPASPPRLFITHIHTSRCYFERREEWLL